MKLLPTQALGVVSQFWRHKWLSLAAAWVICAAGWVGASFIPTRFESTARVYVNADGLLTPLLHGLAIDDNPARHLDFLRRTLLSRPNLQQAVHLSNLDMGAADPARQEALLLALAKDVQLTPQTATLLAISYRNPDPVVARNVVQSLLTIFAENTTGSNRAEMENAKKFINEQIANYETQLRGAEARRAEFHEKYLDILPGADGAVSRLETARGELVKYEGVVVDAQSRRDAIKSELAMVPQFLNIDAVPQVLVMGRATTPAARLDEARGALANLLQRYTERHPDVIATRRQIAELEAQVKAGGSGPGSGQQKSQIVNVVYEQLKIRLVDADSQVAAAEKQLADARNRLQILEERARSAPGIQAKVQNLDRDYSILKKNYEELLARREAAHIADAADTNADKIQFRVVDAPQVPTIPAYPNRPLILSGVLVAGLLGGLGVPVLLMQFDRSFATISSLRRLGIPILGSISRTAMVDAQRRDRVQLAAVCGAALALLMVYSVLLAASLNLFQPGIT